MSKKKVDDGYKRNLVMYYVIKPILLLVAKAIYNPKIVGKDNIPKKDGCVIACNHVHAFDPAILIYSTRRIVHFIAKKEIFLGKMKWFYLSFGAIPVDRDKKNPLALAVAYEYLNNNEVIGIFPEGTRNGLEKSGEMKNGATYIAIKTGASIVPIGIKGKMKPFNKITITYGEKIDYTEYAKQKLKRFALVCESTLL